MRRGEKRKGAGASSANKEKLRRGILAELGKAPSAVLNHLSYMHFFLGLDDSNSWIVRTQNGSNLIHVYKQKVLSFSEVFVRVWLQKAPR
jgi:hypothetical protein